MRASHGLNLFVHRRAVEREAVPQIEMSFRVRLGLRVPALARTVHIHYRAVDSTLPRPDVILYSKVSRKEPQSLVIFEG